MAHPMTSSGRGARVVGDYVFGRPIGSGSFSVVWLARHRIHGTEVAVKEIAMNKLSKKLQDSLMQEIVILKKIKHPNIIALHDIIETSGRIFLILELCKGGDLSMFIQNHGRMSEATAKHFMQQLACGLQVLRENNLIHRDLKPQNLLLSRNDDSAVLKIADFGFARSLQPRGLAETLCGSPLYMAPEIMQLQKYDAKADLWSVGAILFQLVTGKTPFTGNNQIQLLQNIMKSTELHFQIPPNQLSGDCVDICQKLLRRNPVERLTFEEFFNHPFLSQSLHEEPMSVSPSKGLQAASPSEGLQAASPSKGLQAASLVECSCAASSDANRQDDGLLFIFDDLPAKTTIPGKKPTVRSTYGFSVDNKGDNIHADRTPDNPPMKTDFLKTNSSKEALENAGSRADYCRSSLNPNESNLQIDQRSANEDHNVVDSLEFIDREYVLVPDPLDISTSSIAASRPCNSPPESENSPIPSPDNCAVSAPMPIIDVASVKPCATESLESRSSLPSGNSQGSVDMGDAMEQPSSHCMTRIRSLQQCAYAITELVNEKVVAKPLEAFSIQLVILAIWKQALHICHAQAASAIEGSPSQEARSGGNVKSKESQDSRESLTCTDSLPPDVHSQIEKAFLSEVENAEELAKNLGPSDNTAEMPDAMEMIFQSALSLGRNGAVEELMDNMDSATILYMKAVQLLYFLLVEAPSLFLNPPFSLTTTDRYRLRSYIDILNNRQNQYRSQRIALLKGDGYQQSP